MARLSPWAIVGERKSLVPEQDPVTIPPVDVFEDESGITSFADLPGATRAQLGVRVGGDPEGRGSAAAPHRGVRA